MFEKHAQKGRLVNLDGTPQARLLHRGCGIRAPVGGNWPAHQHARTPHPVGFWIASDWSLQRA